MEEKEEEVNTSSGDIIKGDEAPEKCKMEPMDELPSQVSESEPAVTVTPAIVALPLVTSEVKKKRGRPRKYLPDGSINTALSPMPISSSIPLIGEFSARKHSAGLPIKSFKKKHKLETERLGNHVLYSVGANFTAHLITITAGMDVSMKIMSFAQQGSRAICVLSANGSISNVTLHQSNSLGGTVTYEGCFEILSLTGSFMPSDGGITKSRSGGMSVLLAGPDGRVLGGGLAGLLVAARPVQVMVGSFIPGQQLEQKPKKQRYESAAAFTLTATNPISQDRNEGSYSGDDATCMNFALGWKVPSPLNNNISFAGPESTGQSPSMMREVSC